MDDRFEPRVERIADQERRIQAGIDANAGSGGGEAEKAVQAGARKYPEPPFPKQHQTRPGEEAALDPAPMYEAPFWKGSGKLDGMAAIITGGDSGIGRAVAVLFAREGCDIAICHLDEEKDAKDTKAAVEAEGRKAIVLKGDAADPAFSEAAVKATLDAFGRLDVVVPNAAFQETSSPPGRSGPRWNPADQQADRVAKFGSKTVMKRPAQPEEIAPAFVFLASPQMSSYITGEVLPIIGGYGGG